MLTGKMPYLLFSFQKILFSLARPYEQFSCKAIAIDGELM